MTNNPFLISHPDDLRTKINGLTGLWRRRWEHFLACAEAEQRTIRWYGSHQMCDVPTYAAFAWVVTQDPKWSAIARRDLVWLEKIYPDMRKGAYSDRDTWMWAAPMLRRAISLDWIWDSDALSDQERDRFAELFITDALKYSYIVLRHRIPPHASNQGLAMALNLVTVGYLFGVKHGSDIRARRLMEFGLPHLLHQIAALPPDAYSGEGSTYLCGVEAPLMTLACAVLEEVTGENMLRKQFKASGNSILRALELTAYIIPPSGVLPGWDHYRFMLSTSATPSAYLASRTGDPKWYDFVMHGPGWERSGHFAWMRDGYLWQFLWMPDPTANTGRDGKPYYPEPWHEPHVGGSLLSRDDHLHLLQMWDAADQKPVRCPA
ncbi:MAG: hypothetical protein K9N51_09695 [Candidatus Pacebacteria bacterium]|nr:hypothetical protein [Candidatus Paceibacterota bacterium]